MHYGSARASLTIGTSAIGFGFRTASGSEPGVSPGGGRYGWGWRHDHDHDHGHGHDHYHYDPVVPMVIELMW